MSIIQELQNQVHFLKQKVTEKEEKIDALETDIRQMGSAVLDTIKEFGIDPINGDMSKLSIGSILPKITMKAMSGKLKLEKLGEALPTLKKYQYLLEENTNHGI